MKTKLLFLNALFILSSLIGSAQSWNQKTNFGGTGRVHAVAFSIGTKGYIGTGAEMLTFSVPKTVFDDFWEWDQPTNVWTQKASVGGGVRYMATGFALGGKGYIGTGFSYVAQVQQQVKDFWEYDPGTNAWAKRADYGGSPIALAVGFSIGNKGYIGTGALDYSKDLWEYDPAADAWARKADFPGIARGFAVGFSIGSKGYIGSGLNTQDLFNDFYEYDPATDKWTARANVPGPSRILAAGFSIGDKGFVGTGADKNNTPLADFYEYDPSTDKWTQRPDYGGGLTRDAVAFSIGDNGYIGTGSPVWNKSNAKNDFWEYSAGTQTVACTLTASAFSDPSSICAGKTIVIYASGGTTYSWSTGSTDNHITASPTITTSYVVTGTNAAGCVGTASITITVSNCQTSVSEINTASIKAVVSPSPFSESADILLTGVESAQPYEMRIFDVLGNEVRSIHFAGKQTTIEKGNLSNGVYLLEVRSANMIERIKFIIN